MGTSSTSSLRRFRLPCPWTSRPLVRFLSASCLLATVTATLPSAAYCRKTTGSPEESGFDPTVKGTCGDSGGALPLYWPTDCVEYKVIVEPEVKSKFSEQDAEALVRDAVNAWTNAQCVSQGGGGPRSPYLRLENVDRSRCNGGPLGGRIENEIRFTDRPSPEGSVLAKTNSKFDMKTGAIAESQIRIFRDAQYDDFTKKETIARLKNIVRHELGHFLGLAHSNDSRAAMYAYYEPKKTDALLEDDTAAICDAYNPDGPVNQGCDVAPTVTSTFREASALPPAFLVGLTFTWLAKRRRGRNSPRTPARFP